MNVYIASPNHRHDRGAGFEEIAKWIKSIYPDANVYCSQDCNRGFWASLDSGSARQFFDKNLKHLETADLVVCAYSNEESNTAAWEVGYAKAKGKEVWLIAPRYWYDPISIMFVTVDKIFSLEGPEEEIKEINWDKSVWG